MQPAEIYANNLKHTPRSGGRVGRDEELIVQDGPEHSRSYSGGWEHHEELLGMDVTKNSRSRPVGQERVLFSNNP